MGFDSRENAKTYTPVDGDTLRSIAERERANGNPVTWQELARFNWGTDDEGEIDTLMRDELGARMRDADNRFVVSTDDRPRSSLLIPRPFERAGLPTRRTHVLRIRRKRLSPQFLGCHSLPSVVFALESSFIRPEVVEHLKLLGMMADAHPDARVMVFGHSDASGSEIYNKKLSERRAWSAHAFIVNDPEAWETLYNHPDEEWGVPVVQEILADLGHYDGSLTGSLDAATRDAMRSFSGLAEDAPVSNDADFRRALFSEYMSSKHDIHIAKERFVDPGFMGCGEFNPLEEGEPRNETNRRVTFFLFHPDRVPNLPCAFADTAPCHRQMVSLENRHSETFKCSFYDSLARSCGCESVDLLQIRLFDPFGAPMAHTPCTVTVGSHDVFATSDDDGWVEARIVGAHERATVSWGEREDLDDDATGDAAPTFPYRLGVFLDCATGGEADEQALKRLYNLGYDVDLERPAAEQRGAIQKFQIGYRDRFDLEALSGELDDATVAAITEVHDNCDPDVWGEEA